MINLLHVGLILIISRVFTILCLLCLCKEWEYCGNFQNKAVTSKQLFSQMSAQVRWEGRSFWSGQEAYIYSLNYLLPTYRGNVNYYKSVRHPIPTLPFGNREVTAPSVFKINQYINSPFNWVSRYVLFLPRLKGKERPFFDGCKKGYHIAILSLGWYK